MTMPTEDLADESLGSIALNGAPELSGGRNAEPGASPGPWQDEDRHQAAAVTRPLVVHLLEIVAAADALGRAESHVHGCPPMRVA
jgi:hypothetical protein